MPRKATNKDYLALINNPAFVELVEGVQAGHFEEFRSCLDPGVAVDIWKQSQAVEELIALLKDRARQRLESVPDPAA